MQRNVNGHASCDIAMLCCLCKYISGKACFKWSDSFYSWWGGMIGGWDSWSVGTDFFRTEWLGVNLYMLITSALASMPALTASDLFGGILSSTWNAFCGSIWWPASTKCDRTALEMDSFPPWLIHHSGCSWMRADERIIDASERIYYHGGGPLRQSVLVLYRDNRWAPECATQISGVESGHSPGSCFVWMPILVPMCDRGKCWARSPSNVWSQPCADRKNCLSEHQLDEHLSSLVLHLVKYSHKMNELLIGAWWLVIYTHKQTSHSYAMEN